MGSLAALGHDRRKEAQFISYKLRVAGDLKVPKRGVLVMDHEGFLRSGEDDTAV
jgi:hypothetical protein